MNFYITLILLVTFLAIVFAFIMTYKMVKLDKQEDVQQRKYSHVVDVKLSMEY